MNSLDDLIMLMSDAELKEILLCVDDKEIVYKVSKQLIKNTMMTQEQKKKIDALHQPMPAALVSEKNNFLKQLINK